MDNTDTEHYDNMRKTIDMKLLAAFPMRQKEDHKTTTMERLQQVKAASTIQRHFRNWKNRTLAAKASFQSGVNSDDGGEDGFLKISNGKDDRQHKLSLQRLFTDNKLTRTLSSLSIRSPFSRKRLDSSSSPETSVKKTAMTRSHSAYSGRKINSKPMLLSSPSKKSSAPTSPTKSATNTTTKKSILRSSDSVGSSPCSGKLSQHNQSVNSSSVASSGQQRRIGSGGGIRKKAHHQVKFFEPSCSGPGGADTMSTTRTTISKASSSNNTNDEDQLDSILHHAIIGDDVFYSDEDDSDNEGGGGGAISSGTTHKSIRNDDECDCKECEARAEQEQPSPARRSNILIEPYKKTQAAEERAASISAGSKLSNARNSNNNNKKVLVHSSRLNDGGGSGVKRTQSELSASTDSVKTHPLAESSLSLKEMPNVRL